MKISKLITVLGIGLILSISTVQLCEAANSLTCWYAFEDGNETTKGYYLTSNFVGKVVAGQNESSREVAATALVDGMVPWNRNNIALNQLGISLRSIPYTSTATYNVEFEAGDYLYVLYTYGGISSNAIGKTIRGNVSNRRAITFNSIIREIFADSGNSSTSSSLTKVVLITGESTNKYKYVGAHEIGHVLGWYGHSTDTQALMHRAGGNNGTNYTVTTKDINHIKQFYELGN